MRIISFAFSLNDWDMNNLSGLLDFKKNFIEIMSSVGQPDDYWCFWPDLDLIEIGEMVSKVANYKNNTENLDFCLTNMVRSLNGIEVDAKKYVFVISNEMGISDYCLNFIKRINLGINIKLLGLFKPFKNFQQLNCADDIYSILRGELKNDN